MARNAGFLMASPACFGRAGDKVSFQGGLGMVSDEGESDLKFGGAAGFLLAPTVSVRRGIG